MRRAIACLFFLCSCLPGAGHNVLLPPPRKVAYGDGRIPVHKLSIGLGAAPSSEDRFAADQLSAILAAKAGRVVPVAVGGTGRDRITLLRSGAADPLPAKQETPGPDSRESYRIRVTGEGAELRARSSAGIFYAVETLGQLVEGEGDEASLPFVEIEDWPDLSYRGVMMDLSHGPLPTVQEIERQIDFLARWKGNQYYFY